MIENNRQDYRQSVNALGKREFTLQKMQEYGFWPENLKTPYERQNDETEQAYEKRKRLQAKLNDIAEKIIDLYKEKSVISQEIRNITKQYDDTWDIDKIRREVAKKIMQQSLKRRAERKKEIEQKKLEKSNAWNAYKAENIVFIGKKYSTALCDKVTDDDKLNSLGLPIIKDDHALAELLCISYKDLRSLTYHRDVVVLDHYFRYTVPKKSGGERNIAAPKSVLKHSQRKILELILDKIELSNNAHGFIKQKSVVTGANVHIKSPELLIKIDLENFFNTITFERVRGLFKSFGYSGFVASLLAMLCTYCERMPIEIKGQTKYVKTSDRILPQGSPASPMITNIICRALDLKINLLADNYGFIYSRYADDMSFSFDRHLDNAEIKKILYQIQSIVYEQGFKINKEKTRYLRKNNRQAVTGIVINNDEIGVPKVWVKKFRAIIHNANKLKEKGEVPEEILNEISGMASWLIGVNPNRYQKIISDAKKICE